MDLSAKPAAFWWDLLEEHLDEATFLFGQWEAALSDPAYDLNDVVDGPERRLRANLDGLVVGGVDAAEELLLPALSSDEEGTAFAAAAALLASEAGDFLGGVVEAFATAEPEARPPLVRALQLSARADLYPRLAPLLARGDAATQESVLRVFELQRLDPRARLDPLLGSSDPALRCAVLHLGRWFPERLDPSSVERVLTASHPGERLVAIETGLILGVRQAWAELDALARSASPGWELFAPLWATAGEADLAPLLGALPDERRREAAIRALGLTGLPGAIDALLPLLEDVRLGPGAADALSLITGLRIEGPFSVDPERDEGDVDEDETEVAVELRAPNPATIREWWAKNRARFDPRARWLGGQPWTIGALLDRLERGPMHRRRALALDLAIRTRGAMQLDVRDFAGRQLDELARFRATPMREGGATYRAIIQHTGPQRAPLAPRNPDGGASRRPSGPR